MSKDDNTNADAPQNDLPIDGGELTAEEQVQADLLAKEGSGDGVDTPAEDTTLTTAPEAADAAAAAAVESAAADAAASEQVASAVGDAPAPAPAAAPDPKPEPSKDWDKEMDALADKFDAGDLDTAAYQKELRRLMTDESSYNTDVRLWTDRQTRSAAAAESEFNGAALAWERNNAAFMANPLRAKAMQEAIDVVGAQHPELSPAAMFDEAAKVAFEAYNFTTPAVVDDPADKDKIAAAVAGRRTAAAPAPATLGTAPAAAQFDPSKSSFSQIDELGIDDMENALARLPQDKLELFLLDAPGATSRGE